MTRCRTSGVGKTCAGAAGAENRARPCHARCQGKVNCAATHCCGSPRLPAAYLTRLFHCSIAAESARAVAAAEGQVRALELEASDAKRDAGKRMT